MKKYLLTVCLLGSTFSFMGQGMATPCRCDINDPKKQTACNPNERKTRLPDRFGSGGIDLSSPDPIRDAHRNVPSMESVTIKSYIDDGTCQDDCHCPPTQKCRGNDRVSGKVGDCRNR